MKQTYEELVEIVESLQKENRGLKRRMEQLEKELRKYLNENTPSGAIPPYLKKLKDTVNRYAEDDVKPMTTIARQRAIQEIQCWNT
jgi:cell division protein FtsB